MVAYALPVVAVGHSIPLVVVDKGAGLLAMLSSFALDYVLRQKLGGVNLTYNYVQQLPVLSRDCLHGAAPWDAHQTVESWIVPLSVNMS